MNKYALEAMEAALCWSAEDRRLWDEYVRERSLDDKARREGWYVESE